uniref:Uncharacterized protein n=1 Tax=Populus trichocarpa TaxID=3694 RepID=B9HRK2_POPTR
MQEVAAATQEQQESYKDDLVDESGEEDAELNAETNLRLSVVHPVFPVLLSCSSLICSSGANREEMGGLRAQILPLKQAHIYANIHGTKIILFCGRKVIDRILSLSYLFFKQLHPALSTWRD